MLNLFPQGKDDILTMNEKAMLSKRKKKRRKKTCTTGEAFLKMDVWKGLHD